jgi:HPt (histidine-containing phosphotransfer) domain-containing protein
LADEIDLSFLARQTGGDADLAREVLDMFTRQVPGELQRLMASGDQERREIAHRIVGSARAIGAGAVADAAAAIEQGGGDVAQLHSAVEAALAFLRRPAD